MSKTASTRTLKQLAVVVGIGLFLAGLAWTLRLAIQLPPDEMWIDYQLYTRASSALMAGADPYEFRTISGDGHVFYGYVYPPIVAWTLAPIVALLPFRPGYFLWLMMCTASLTASLVVLLRAFRSPVPWWLVALTLGGTSLAFIVRDNLFHGQIDVILLLFVTLGLWMLARGREIPAGVLLGLAASCKPFLGILLVLLLWRRQYRSAISMVITGIVVLVLGFLPTLSNGTAVIEGWIGASRYASSPAFASFTANHSLSGLFLRLFTQTPYATPWIESQALLLIADAALLALIVTVWLRAVPRGPFPTLAIESDLVATPGLLLFADSGLLLGLLYAFGPLAEANHFFLLVPGMVGAIRLATSAPTRAVRRRWRPAAIAWAMLLVAIASPLRAFTWAHPIEEFVTGPAVLLTGRLGLLLLTVALVAAWSRWRERQATALIPAA